MDMVLLGGTQSCNPFASCRNSIFLGSKRIHASSDTNYLESKFRSSPVSPLEIVPDLVVSSHPDPVGHLPVLLQLLGQFKFQRMRFVCSHTYLAL